jgi:hypothetical protein
MQNSRQTGWRPGDERLWRWLDDIHSGPPLRDASRSRSPSSGRGPPSRDASRSRSPSSGRVPPSRGASRSRSPSTSGYSASNGTPAADPAAIQHIVWNPKYHSVDASRASPGQGFYGVKNALGPEGKTLFISSFEAEVLCQPFADFYRTGPLKDVPLDEALAKGAVHLYYTEEKFRHCVPHKANADGTLLAMFSHVPIETQKALYAALRKRRAAYLSAASAAGYAVIDMTIYARSLLTLDDIEDSGLSEADIEIARQSGGILNAYPLTFKPLLTDDVDMDKWKEDYNSHLRILSCRPGTMDPD